MKTETGTVFLVDDDPALRDAIRVLLKTEGWDLVAYSSAQEFLDHYDESTVGCLLLDIRMPGMSGLELQEKLAERRLSIPVIVITGYADTQVTVRSVKLGAMDFLEKPFKDEVLLERIHQAIEEHRGKIDRQQERSEITRREGRLTPRERQVLGLLVLGNSNKNIAEQLGISRKTLDIHRANVMKKMQAETVAHLVRMSLIASCITTRQ